MDAKMENVFEELYVLLYNEIEFALKELEKGNTENVKLILEEALTSAWFCYITSQRGPDAFVDPIGHPVLDTEFNIFTNHLHVNGLKEPRQTEDKKD